MLERAAGIEPASLVWKTSALPLSYARRWVYWEAITLPAEPRNRLPDYAVDRKSVAPDPSRLAE